MYGLLPVETPNWSPGELLAVVKAGRRRDQRTAVLLHTHAALCRKAIDGNLPAVYEAFPMWSEEEIYTMKGRRLQKKLLAQVRVKGGGEQG